MLRYVAMLALCLCTLNAQAAATPAGTPAAGSLVIVGGALRADNAAVWERMVKLAGGKGARIAVFPTAAGNPDRSGNRLLELFRSYGADPFLVRIAPQPAPAGYERGPNDAATAAQVAAAGGAFFAGGDQSRITRALRNPDGSNTLVLDALWRLYRSGGMVGGTSAGAAIMSAAMIDNAPPILDMLKSGVVDGREVAPGLGFIGDDVFVDQHLLVRGRFARMMPVMLKKGLKVGLGIDENTAMIVDARREVEVLGYRGAVLLELAGASSKPGAFNISNARISYLDSGDRYQIGTGKLTPSADKTGGLVDPAKPSNMGPLFYGDILGNTTVVEMMEKLIDSSEAAAVGLAFGGPLSGSPQTGFEFKLSKTADSIGYESATSAHYSVYRLRLDVRPVRLAQPLYTDELPQSNDQSSKTMRSPSPATQPAAIGVQPR